MTAEQLPHITTAEALRRRGYRPFTIAWRSVTHDLPTYGLCRDFDVIGDVPSASGLYLFTTRRRDLDDEALHVRYVGRTAHLWMTTKGMLPGAGGRGGQRYGRPRHAGPTRRRINAALTADAAAGLEVGVWVQRVSERDLHAAEEADITSWELRRYGLNRG